MRILRVRRGFTTNSSGANEYIPSDAGTRDAGPGIETTTGQVESSARTGEAAAPMGNAVVIGLMTAGVVMLFVVERVAHYLWGKKPGRAAANESRDADDQG